MKQFYIFAVALLSYGSFAQCPATGITLSTQAQVDDFEVQYPGCTTINGDVIITGSNITSLNALSGVTTITGALEVRNNPSLTSLNGLHNLTSIGTDLILRSNPVLNNISSLSGITTVGGELTVRTCNALTTVNGLQNITSVGLGLIIRDNANLLNVDGLAGVTFVGEILEVVQNPVLISVAGLANVANVVGGDEGALVIEGNDALTNLTGLGNAGTTFNGDVTIATNTVLALCAVPSICNYLDNPPAGAVVTINTNMNGCNSQAEIEAACTVLSTGYMAAEKQVFRILKNPVEGELLIHSTMDETGMVTVYDTTGKIIITSNLKQGISSIALHAAPGIYLVKMECNGRVEYNKVVVQ
jgi:hypothetical protein